MTARHKYRNDDGDMEFVPNILRWGYTASQQADEGQSGRFEIVIDDPEMVLDFVGHRRWTIYEETSDTANEILVDGITQAVSVAHEGGEITQPTSRVWTVEVNDLNTLWTYRVQTGSGNERPAETDVARMQWLAATEEMSYVEDVTLLATGNPVNMDAADVRGQTSGQVADMCAQESGKNYWLSSDGTAGEIGAEIKLWYGADGLFGYTSPLALSNDPDDLDMPAVDDGTATTYPIGADTELRRDYARQYDAAYGQYQDGAKYIKASENPYAPIITASHRDISYPAPEIKTASRMKQRLLRVLRDHATPDEVITTTIDLPDNKATSIRAGMRVLFKATHFTDYVTARYLRVMTASPQPYGNRYKIRLELQGPGDPPAWSCPLDDGIGTFESKFYDNLGSTTTDADGLIWYTASNAAWFPSATGWGFVNGPKPSTTCHGLGFATYGAGGDCGGSGVASLVGYLITGPGSVTSHWGTYVGAGSQVGWSLIYQKASGPTVQDSGSFNVTGATDHAISIPDLPGDATSCYRHLVYQIGVGISGGSGACFQGLDWVNA